MEFNPFAKDRRDAKPIDLISLRGVGEGWFVEYKREVPSADNIVKSVSAMANSRGGWVFFGISAPSASVGIPEVFPGVATADLPVL